MTSLKFVTLTFRPQRLRCLTTATFVIRLNTWKHSSELKNLNQAPNETEYLKKYHSCSAAKDFVYILWNRESHCCLLILSQFTPINNVTPYFCMIYFKISLPSTSVSSNFQVLRIKCYVNFLSPSCVLYTPPILSCSTNHTIVSFSYVRIFCTALHPQTLSVHILLLIWSHSNPINFFRIQ
jgi:hypothetical protein